MNILGQHFNNNGFEEKLTALISRKAKKLLRKKDDLEPLNPYLDYFMNSSQGKLALVMISDYLKQINCPYTEAVMRLEMNADQNSQDPNSEAQQIYTEIKNTLQVKEGEQALVKLSYRVWEIDHNPEKQDISYMRALFEVTNLNDFIDYLSRRYAEKQMRRVEAFGLKGASKTPEGEPVTPWARNSRVHEDLGEDMSSYILDVDNREMVEVAFGLPLGSLQDIVVDVLPEMIVVNPTTEVRDTYSQARERYEKTPMQISLRLEESEAPVVVEQEICACGPAEAEPPPPCPCDEGADFENALNAIVFSEEEEDNSSEEEEAYQEEEEAAVCPSGVPESVAFNLDLEPPRTDVLPTLSSFNRVIPARPPRYPFRKPESTRPMPPKSPPYKKPESPVRPEPEFRGNKWPEQEVVFPTAKPRFRGPSVPRTVAQESLSKEGGFVMDKEPPKTFVFPNLTSGNLSGKDKPACLNAPAITLRLQKRIAPPPKPAPVVQPRRASALQTSIRPAPPTKAPAPASSCMQIPTTVPSRTDSSMFHDPNTQTRKPVPRVLGPPSCIGNNGPVPKVAKPVTRPPVKPPMTRQTSSSTVPKVIAKSSTGTGAIPKTHPKPILKHTSKTVPTVIPRSGLNPSCTRPVGPKTVNVKIPMKEPAAGPYIPYKRDRAEIKELARKRQQRVMDTQLISLENNAGVLTDQMRGIVEAALNRYEAELSEANREKDKVAAMVGQDEYVDASLNAVFDVPDEMSNEEAIEGVLNGSFEDPPVSIELRVNSTADDMSDVDLEIQVEEVDSMQARIQKRDAGRQNRLGKPWPAYKHPPLPEKEDLTKLPTTARLAHIPQHKEAAAKPMSLATRRAQARRQLQVEIPVSIAKGQKASCKR